MKRLVTERDVLAIDPGGAIPVTPDTLVTPAARDAAFRRSIRFVTQSVASTPLTGLDRLTDGDYLVRVRDGQISIRRVADSER